MSAVQEVKPLHTGNKALTEKRAADRRIMADRVQATAAQLGATVVREEGGWRGPRCIALKITAARGLCVQVDFDGDSSQPDVHVLHWHLTTFDGTKLALAFGEVNTVHFQKATQVSHGLDALIFGIERRLRMAQDGSAFQP